MVGDETNKNDASTRGGKGVVLKSDTSAAREAPSGGEIWTQNVTLAFLEPSPRTYAYYLLLSARHWASQSQILDEILLWNCQSEYSGKGMMIKFNETMQAIDQFNVEVTAIKINFHNFISMIAQNNATSF